MGYLPLVILAVVLGGMLLYARRRREQTVAADADMRQRLRVGSQVMTTSGMYAVIASIDEAEESAMVTIAPGVEVKWTLAALRDVESLPDRYRRAVGPSEDGP